MRKKYFHLHRAWFLGPLIPLILLSVLLIPLFNYGFKPSKEVMARLIPGDLGNSHPELFMFIIIVLIFTFIFMISARYMGRYLMIDAESVYYYGGTGQRGNDYSIKFTDIEEVGEISATDLGLNISRIERPVHYGYFDSDKLGRYRALVIDKKRVVYVKPKDGKGTTYAFSCTKPAKFVRIVNERMKLTEV